MGDGRLIRRFNPLEVSHPVLPRHAVIVAKILLLVAFLKGYLVRPRRGVPLFEFLLEVPDAVYFDVMQVAVLLSAACIVFNVGLRFGCFLLGLVQLVVDIDNMALFAHTKLFLACLLFLLALYRSERGALFLKLQIVILYLGAGFNKALAASWWSGAFLSNYPLAQKSPAQTLLVQLGWEVHVPWLLGIVTIFLELGVAAAILRGRYAVAAMLGLSLHCGILAWTGFDYQIFLWAGAASYLLLLSPPASMEVCCSRGGARDRALRFLHAIEPGNPWIFRPRGSAETTGSRKLLVVAGDVHRTGLQAWAYLLAQSPAVLLLSFYVLAEPSSLTYEGWIRAWVTSGLVALVGMPVLFREAIRGRQGEPILKWPPSSGAGLISASPGDHKNSL
ncbi:MAG: hypothetical protein P8K76_03130 [Candidatus Binatia bacterium]|nr:hypothetical protein [Candidatus Binatia bacterium]